MYTITIYKDARGREPIGDLLRELAAKAPTNKNARIRLKKMQDHIKALGKHGLHLGMPYIRHLDGDIWEIRPTRDRILFFSYTNEHFVLLHHFVKKTQKTPQREIAQAKRNLQNYIERYGYDKHQDR
ncbi:MAG: type II toxin-antitoxin system RelE/ParE family toxin [Pseudomonadota bacterium]